MIMKEELIMLGTGSAMPRHSYNSCFMVRAGRLAWLSDAGGGNGIFEAMRRAGVELTDIHHFFLTHAHTDHILGAVWVLRAIVYNAMEGRYQGRINLYANRETAEACLDICRLTFLKSYYDGLTGLLDLHIVGHGDCLTVEDVGIRFFDCRSENVSQTGFCMRLPSGKTFAALGDEALKADNLDEVAGADYLLCGAFCLHEDRAIFRPYEKHHLTVRDVAETAGVAGVGTLILTHSEDVTERKAERYAAEASRHFGGNIVVPADGEHIML